jgi:hypothetical protein
MASVVSTLHKTLFIFLLAFFTSLVSQSAFSEEKPKKKKETPPSQLMIDQADAERGVTEAQYALSMRYFDANEVPADDKLASQWLHKAIDKQYGPAIHYMASLYESGRTVPKNIKTAADWYRKAAKLGVVEAQRKMGHIYKDGAGVVADPVTAYAWFNIAASNSGDWMDKIYREYIAYSLQPADLERAQALSDTLLKTD